MSDNLPVPTDSGMIFPPSLENAKKLADAEATVTTVKRQRSVALLLATIAGAMVFALLLGSIIWYNSTDRSSDKRVELAFGERDRANRALKEANDALERLQAQQKLMAKYESIAAAEFQVREAKAELDALEAFYKGQPISGLDPKTTLQFEVKEWTWQNPTPVANWDREVLAKLRNDRLAYQKASNAVKTWALSNAAKQPPKFVAKPCPFAEPYCR